MTDNSAILCIDFDGTIVAEAYPHIGPLKPNAKQILQKLHEEGYYIIIWTCRSDKLEQEARSFLLYNGIPFDRINQPHPECIKHYGNIDCRKIGADIYIDDRQLSGIPDDWSDIYQLIKRHKSYLHGRLALDKIYAAKNTTRSSSTIT